MYCTQCGKQNNETAKFCTECGTSLEDTSGVAPINRQTDTISNEVPVVMQASQGEKKRNLFIPTIIIIIVGLVVLSLLDTPSPSPDTTIFNNTPQSTSDSIASSVIDTEMQNSNLEKCVNEHGVKICDLKYSSKPTEGVIGYRDVLAEGNSVSCINMSSNEIITNSAEFIRAETSDTFCVSDFGYVYIDPSIQVTKYWNTIKRDSYVTPYYIDSRYDTCLWTWEDGSGRIPYMETYGNIGPRTGYDVRAFCKNGQKEVDIYSYEQE